MAGRALDVWDLPTRLFHWALAGLIGFAWWSVANHHLDWHKTAGSLIAGLLVFRLWWGFFGGSTARFGAFLRGPRAVLRYGLTLRGKGEPAIGHNPMGGWSVVALLATTLAVVALGLFASDTDGLESGPLSDLVSYDMSRLASRWHDLTFDALKVLVVVHLLAIAFYAFVKRDSLIPAMLTGRKRLDVDAAPLKPARVWALLVGVALGGLTSAWLVHANGG